jgi:hypothetical protein
MTKILAVLVVSLSFTAPVLAEGGPPPESGAPSGARPHPPKEAMTACEGKKIDDICSFFHTVKAPVLGRKLISRWPVGQPKAAQNHHRHASENQLGTLVSRRSFEVRIT